MPPKAKSSMSSQKTANASSVAKQKTAEAMPFEVDVEYEFKIRSFRYRGDWILTTAFYKGSKYSLILAKKDELLFAALMELKGGIAYATFRGMQSVPASGDLPEREYPAFYDVEW